MQTQAGNYLGVKVNNLTARQPWVPEDNEATVIHSKAEAAEAFKVWNGRYPNAGLKLVAVECSDLELDEKIAPFRLAYAATKKLLDALPRSRMQALALTDLESSFSRAMFAASEMTDPIGGA